MEALNSVRGVKERVLSLPPARGMSNKKRPACLCGLYENIISQVVTEKSMRMECCKKEKKTTPDFG